jgi:hypothetical protein
MAEVLCVYRDVKLRTETAAAKGEPSKTLKDRIMAAMDEFNRDPVVHTWSYKLDQAAR